MTTTGPMTLDMDVIWKCHWLDMPAMRTEPSRPLGGEHGNEPVTQYQAGHASGTGLLLTISLVEAIADTSRMWTMPHRAACASAIAAGTGALALATFCRCHQAILSHTIWTYLVLHGTLIRHGCPGIHWQDPCWVWIVETDAMLVI